MCGLTYIPDLKDKENFVLTFSRDESPLRQVSDFVLVQEGKKSCLYPKDPKGGGSWIVVSNEKRVACLLNGAFVKHEHRPPYKISRGLMLLQLMQQYPSLLDFVATYDFEGIEPFTLVSWENGRLYELRWDEKQLYPQELDPQKYYIWSSATLYSPEIQKMRQSWFEEWIGNRRKNFPQGVFQFHHEGGIGDPEIDMLMSRAGGKVQTISITQVVLPRYEPQFLVKIQELPSKNITDQALPFLL